eukprot:6205664-Pleurochrysis_carterae.AAC.7
MDMTSGIEVLAASSNPALLLDQFRYFLLPYVSSALGDLRARAHSTPFHRRDHTNSRSTPRANLAGVGCSTRLPSLPQA